MKRQVILDIINQLEEEKKEAKERFKEDKDYNGYEGTMWALEEAIKIVLEKAGILDCRPAHQKHI